MCMLSCFVISVSASTTTTSGSNTISPSDDELKAAKSPTYSGTSERISGSISSSYEMDIYHYEAPTEGYYAIYTTGSLDTVGAVYEHQNVLWWTTSYENVAYSDDGCQSDNYRNCSMVVRMDRGEDFYICVRAYGANTGNYTLVIEPNEDKKASTTGGLWTCDYISNAKANSGVWTTKKNYLTREQALLNYLLLEGIEWTDPDTKEVINFEVIQATYNEDVDKAIELATKLLSKLTKGKPVVSLSVTLLGNIISEVYSASTETVDELIDIFKEKCGITSTLESIGDGSVTVKFTAQNGMLKKTWFSTFTFNDYYANNDTLLTGEKYCYGSWS